MNVQQVIRPGRANARRKIDLAVSLDWTDRHGRPDTRRVEKAIEALRKSGSVAVCSSETGYFIAETSEEIWSCYRWLRSKYLSQARTAWALRRAAQRMEAAEAVPLAFEWVEAA